MLCVSGKVYQRGLTERLMEVTEEKLSEEQGGLMKGKRYVDLIYAIRMIEKYFRKDKKKSMQPS